MRRFFKSFFLACVCGLITLSAFAKDAPFSLLDVMQEELSRSMLNLAKAKQAPMYYLMYAVTEVKDYELANTNGAFEAPQEYRRRYLEVNLRVGDNGLDNTHEIREGNWEDNYSVFRSVDFPIEDDRAAMRAALWEETEYQYLMAQERYIKVLSNTKVKVEEEDRSGDFSPATPRQFQESPGSADIDTNYWRKVLARVGEYFCGFPQVLYSQVSLKVHDQVNYLVSSEGHRLQHRSGYVYLMLNLEGIADDGMKLYRYEAYPVLNKDHLPGEAEIMKTAQRLVQELDSLIRAPLIEPYAGPAILRNRASGVFFHEIFGHRIEGHRQKSEREGQTFTKKVGELIFPEFISIYDDPTMDTFNGKDLLGNYRFDDEGTASQRVSVVEHGVLKKFLMSRSPVKNFPSTNGHGRRQPGYGYPIVARQGNLVIESSQTVPYAQLRELFIEELKKQHKEYGLVFDDIAGGFTNTSRYYVQAFKVLPLYVYRVYADGRPDEVVRGVDIVGTPLTSLSKILMTGDDYGVFSGFCGAESGMVPVSSVSPSIMVSEIEVEKQAKQQSRPPILPAPRSDLKK